MSVGSNGNILRWPETREVGQEFQLIAHLVNKPKPSLPETGVLPDPPTTLARGEKPPETTEKVLVEVDAVPAVLIYDDDFGHKYRHTQMEQSPYYIVKHYQYWDAANGRGGFENRDGQTAQTIETIISHGWSTLSKKSVQETFSISGTAAHAGLSLTVGYNLEKLSLAENSTEGLESRKVTENIPALGKPYIYAVWSKVDYFEVYNYSGEKRVNYWEYVKENDEFERTYPISE